MKNTTTVASTNNTSFFALFGNLFNRMGATIKMIIFLTLLSSITSCFKNYVKTRPATFSDSTAYSINHSNKLLILFTKKNLYQLSNIVTDKEKVTADINPLSKAERRLIYQIEGRNRTYKHRDKEFILSQIHLITNMPDPIDSTHITFPLSEVTKVETYERDGGKTILSYSLSSLAIYLAIGVIGGLIAIFSALK